jgi:hypothetical protein
MEQSYSAGNILHNCANLVGCVFFDGILLGSNASLETGRAYFALASLIGIAGVYLISGS